MHACVRGGAHYVRGGGRGRGGVRAHMGGFGAKNAEIGFLGVEKRVRKTHSLFCHLH